MLLTSVASVSNHTKCVSLSYQKCMTQKCITLSNLHPCEYIQELCYYSFAVNLHWCAGSCNALDDLCSRACMCSK